MMITKAVVRNLWLAGFVLVLSVIGECSDCPPRGKPGFWSTNAVYLCSRWDGSQFVREIRIASPDGQKAVHVVGDHWVVEVGNKILSLDHKTSYVSFYPAELAWAPDSNAFYIVQSDATSEINGFHTELFGIEQQELKPLVAINRLVGDDLARRYKCLPLASGSDPEDYPNIAGLKWMDGSAKIVVIAEVVPHSSCEHMGYFGGYVVSVSDGTVVNRYSPQDVMTRWPTVVGTRLQDDFKGLGPKEKHALP